MFDFYHYYDDQRILLIISITENHHQHQRELTFLDVDDATADAENDTVSDTGLIIGFSILAAVFFLVTLLIIRVNAKCQEFYEWNAIRLIMPAVSCFLCIENATLAFDSARPVVATQWAIAVFMLGSTIAPGIFLFTFVLTFLAYKNRSMPFCFVYRGPGRQTREQDCYDDDEEVVQPLVRPAVLIVAVRLFALGLLILNLIVNFDVVWNENDLAGRTGWRTVVQDPSSSSLDHLVLALLPMAMVSLCCLYFSLLLWRYGCEFSYVIYSNGIVNPWLLPVIGTLAMIIGQLFGPDLFLIASNCGILIFMLSMVRVLYEARYDIQQSGDLGNFLNALGNDSVTRTQSGVEKCTQEDTLSSGQHRIFSENQNIGASNDNRDVPPPLSPSNGCLDSSSTPDGSLPFLEESHRLSPSRDEELASHETMTGSPTKASALSCRENIPNIEGGRVYGSDAVSTMHSYVVKKTSEQGEDNKDTVNETEADAAFTAQRVEGIAKRPPKLKNGEKPKGKYVVH